MRLRMKTASVLLLTVATISAGTAIAQNPAKSAGASSVPHRAELALGYSYLHSNAPPGGCGCFNLNGGNATFAWAIKPGSWDVVGDVVAGYAGGVSSAGYSLTLSTYTAGVRYLPPVGHSSFQPFGQASGGRRPLQRVARPGAESRNHKCRRGLRGQLRRRPRPARESAILHPLGRSRLPADHVRQRIQQSPEQPAHHCRSGPSLLREMSGQIHRLRRLNSGLAVSRFLRSAYEKLAGSRTLSEVLGLSYTLLGNW